NFFLFCFAKKIGLPKFTPSGELHVQETGLQQFTQGFSPTPLPPVSPRTPGIWHGDQHDAAAIGRTGTAGNDRATQSTVGRHHDSSGSLQEVPLAGVGSDFLSTPSSLR